ncbi:7865_t:CDS:1, partial [Acaulospora morrowiae]
MDFHNSTVYASSNHNLTNLASNEKQVPLITLSLSLTKTTIASTILPTITPLPSLNLTPDEKW